MPNILGASEVIRKQVIEFFYALYDLFQSLKKLGNLRLCTMVPYIEKIAASQKL